MSPLPEILKLCREIENDFSIFGSKKDELSGLLQRLSTSENPFFHKLAHIGKHLHPKMSLQHFINFVVPIERALDRSLRDDEFLITTTDLKSPFFPRVPLEFVLENIRSAFNVGYIFRTADGLGVQKIHLLGYTQSPKHASVQKTDLGADSVVEFEEHEKFEDLLPSLKNRGLQIIALETAQKAIPLYDLNLAQPTVLVVGNERFGLNRQVLDCVDKVAQLPVYGQKNSLNVSIALSVAGFEWRRQWDLKVVLVDS